MVKYCNRFAKLALDYLGETRIDAAEFSTFLRKRDESSVLIHPFFGDFDCLEMILTMVYRSRHILPKLMARSDWDRMAFFVEYQLRLPLEESVLISPFLRGAASTDALIMEVVAHAQYKPKPSPWSSCFIPDRRDNGIPAVLSLTGKATPATKPAPKPLPKPTHKAPDRLQ